LPENRPDIRHVIVTGGTGYIGRRVAAAALRAGYRVTVLARSAAGVPTGAGHFAWRLGEALPAGSLDGALPGAAHAVIHCAHDWRNETNGGQEGGLNLAGTRTLLGSCRRAGVGRFVFVSSQSARADAPNIYGRVKWRIGQMLEADEIELRVGLVYGGPPRAMWGLLCRLTGLAPVLPMIDPWRPVQPIHIDEVVEGIVRVVARQGGGWMGLAAPEGMAFGAFLRTLAQSFFGRKLTVLPVPLRLVLAGCAVSARVPFLPRIDRERVLGLAGTRPMDCAAHLRALDLNIMPLEHRLRLEPAGRKALLAEGRALLRYLLGGAPGSMLMRRYARALAAAGEGPLALPAPLRRAPALLRLAEPLSGRSALAQRLRLASTLAETSPEGERMLAAGSRGARLIALVAQVALDGLALPLRLLSRG
jgi:nucleoside-diphosphate-sugar epimerase